MSAYELHSHKVISLATIEKNQTILIRGLELEVDVNHVIGLELWQTQVCMMGGKGDWLVDRIIHVLELNIAYKKKMLVKVKNQLTNRNFIMSFVLA